MLQRFCSLALLLERRLGRLLGSQLADRRDPKNVVLEHVVETVDLEDEIQGLVPRHFSELDGHRPAHSGVENDIELGQHREGLENVLDVGILEGQRNGLARPLLLLAVDLGRGVAFACNRRRIQHLHRGRLLDELFVIGHPRAPVRLLCPVDCRVAPLRFFRHVEDRRGHLLRRLGVGDGSRLRPGDLDRARIGNPDGFSGDRPDRGRGCRRLHAHRHDGAVGGAVDVVLRLGAKIDDDPRNGLRVGLELGHPHLAHERRVDRHEMAADVVDDPTQVENQSPRLGKGERADIQLPVGFQLDHHAVSGTHRYDLVEIGRTEGRRTLGRCRRRCLGQHHVLAYHRRLRGRLIGEGVELEIESSSTWRQRQLSRFGQPYREA